MNTPTDLQPGQSQLLQLPAGAALHLASGRLTVHAAPGWLDFAVDTPPRLLRAGEVYVAPCPLWVRLDAQATSRLSWRWAATPAARPAPAGWRQWLARWRRHAPA